MGPLCQTFFYSVVSLGPAERRTWAEEGVRSCISGSPPLEEWRDPPGSPGLGRCQDERPRLNVDKALDTILARSPRWPFALLSGLLLALDDLHVRLVYAVPPQDVFTHRVRSAGSLR